MTIEAREVRRKRQRRKFRARVGGLKRVGSHYDSLHVSTKVFERQMLAAQREMAAWCRKIERLEGTLPE